MRKGKTAMKFIPLVLVISGAFGLSLVLYRASATPPAFLTVSSSSGKYAINLTGRKARPKLPISTHEVRFDLSKNGKVLLSGKYLHSGDWFDPSFEDLYPQHSWEGENVLHFYRKEDFDNSVVDNIIIVNNTDETIDYIRVKSGGMFLLFDVRPKFTTRLTDTTSRGNLKWISVVGEFSSGRSIKEKGVDFIVRKDLSGSLTFYISITEDGVTIESPQLEKYKGSE